MHKFISRKMFWDPKFQSHMMQQLTVYLSMVVGAAPVPFQQVLRTLQKVAVLKLNTFHLQFGYILYVGNPL